MSHGRLSPGVDGDNTGAEFSSSEESRFDDIGEGENLVIEEHSNQNKPVGGFKKTVKRIFIGVAIITIGVGLFFAGGFFGGIADIAIISPSPIKSETNSKLVYLTGTPEAKEFSDSIFNVTAKGLGLFRVVKMYQWVEENGEYSKKWSEELIDINNEDAKSKGYINPKEMPFSSEKWLADKVMIGSFTIAPELIKQLGEPEPRSLIEEDFQKMHPEGQKAFKLSKEGYFFGLNPEKPNIGDLLVSFKLLKAVPVTILAKQTGDTLEMFLSKNGPVGILRPGVVDIAAIKKTVNLDGGSSSVSIIIRAISILFVIIGIFIVIGKKTTPKSKKLKKQSADNITNKIEEAEKDQHVFVEEVAEEVLEHHESEYQQNPITHDNTAVKSFNTSNNVTQPNSNSALFNSEYESKESNPSPRSMIPPAPEPLDFTFEDSSQGNDVGITSQLQQFGIMDDPGAAISQNNDVPVSLSLEDDTTQQEVRTPFEMQYAEEIPAEVEILSDSPIEDHAISYVPESDTNIPIAHVDAGLNQQQYVDPDFIPTMPAAVPASFEPAFINNAPQIPSEVEVISENEIDTMSIAPVHTDEETAPKVSRESISLLENIIPEIAEEEQDDYEGNGNALKDVPLPPKPVHLQERAPVQNNNLPPLPPPPDFSSIVNGKNVLSANTTSGSQVITTTLPPEPNLNNEQADNAYFVDDDTHSPFGDVLENPYVITEDEKK